MRILIDAYNVIHALPQLRSIALTNIESARDALVEMALALVKPATEVIIVFDGRGATHDIGPALPGIDGLTAVYTAHNLSADSWIERTVYKSAPRNQCTVITSDGGIRDLCRGLGARVFTPERFETEIAKQRTGTTHRPSDAYQEPGDQYDPASQERLKRLRDRLNDQGE